MVLKTQLEETLKRKKCIEKITRFCQFSIPNTDKYAFPDVTNKQHACLVQNKTDEQLRIQNKLARSFSHQTQIFSNSKVQIRDK